MRVLVIGASGRTGSLTTAYALKKGYTVTVLVRKTSSVEPQQGLTIVEGSPLNKDDVKRAFDATPEDPVKAVIVALAASRASNNPFAKPLAPQWFLRDSQRNIREQMRAHNVKRLVAMSAFGSGSSWSQFPLPFKLLFRASNMIHELRDHDEVDKELRHAGEEWDLQWTLAKPTLLRGATGALGAAVMSELVKAGFQITALTRDASTAKVPAGVKAVTVNYDDLSSIRAALKGQDAIVSTLGSQGLNQQELLVQAAIAEGVQRIIPSEFGSDHTTSEARALPVYKDKIEIEEYLAEKTNGTASTYTIVTNNAFFDWGIDYGFIVDAKKKTAKLFDGGDVPFTTTPLYLVGQAVAGVLKKPEETANREVKIHGTTITINSLLKMVQEHTGADGWKLEQWDTAERSNQAYASLKADPSNFHAWGIPMIFRAAFGEGMLVDFSQKNDNALVGIKALTDDEVRQIVKEHVA
ncbi:hypothetical protein AMS68_004174 [Peltaster fructicola]|uniref:NmrA-like domain-containing protein n=1 Tax=Peltaster fructicola TaxID=286661 RepID=A0A6H0XV75_9PEZI|nr:hypothetical protein AMS68_004174 [Peltaster fructicola]